MREIRDPVHGFIYRSSLEEKIIDTPIFQRLRRIKQLALAQLVYPGALHTRFDHSLGVMYLAGKLADKLLVGEDDEIKRLIRIAALLHDVGHGPFSHVSETIVDQFCVQRQASAPMSGAAKTHEVITHDLILHDDSLGKLLSQRDREQIVGLLQGSLEDRILKDIISGPLDVDKQDYLLRDSYFCGVKYGIYDNDRLLDVLEVFQDGSERMLAVSADGIHTLEQFVLAKYYMATQVYSHKIRLITDAMIVRAIQLGITEDKIDYLQRLYTFDGSSNFLEEWLRWDDDVLTTMVSSQHTPDGYCKSIFTDLQQRKLFKRVFSMRVGDLSEPVARQYLAEEFGSIQKDLEEEVGEILEMDPNLIVAKKFTIQSVREQSRNSEGSILVLKDGDPTTFEDESLLFRSIDEAEKDEYLEIYAPVAFKDERDKRVRRRRYAQQIQEIIVKVISKARGVK